MIGVGYRLTIVLEFLPHIIVLYNFVRYELPRVY
jgi:hypothetical protein